MSVAELLHELEALNATESLPPVETTVPTVAIVSPCGGQIASGWIDTLRYAVRDRSLIRAVREVKCASSAGTLNFNACVAECLNLRDAGIITHMAMVHSDICAEAGWLDILWCEMFASGADLMAAIVPIKEPTGRTSTAIGPVSDRWQARCLYLKDRDRLPETFGPESVCGPGERLLVNSGLFLADLRRPWWDADFAFRVHDRIRKTPKGWVAESRSEDWEMSHVLQKAGARIMATWKVRVQHEGTCRFPNYPEP